MKRPYLPLAEMLAGLAEEATELAQAALKLRRAFDKTNPTPMTEDEAIDRLEEEIADVMLYLEQITYSRTHVYEIMQEKDERWQKRIQYYREKGEQKHGSD